MNSNLPAVACMSTLDKIIPAAQICHNIWAITEIDLMHILEKQTCRYQPSSIYICTYNHAHTGSSSCCNTSCQLSPSLLISVQVSNAHWPDPSLSRNRQAYTHLHTSSPPHTHAQHAHLLTSLTPFKFYLSVSSPLNDPRLLTERLTDPTSEEETKACVLVHIIYHTLA